MRPFFRSSGAHTSLGTLTRHILSPPSPLVEDEAMPQRCNTRVVPRRRKRPLELPDCGGSSSSITFSAARSAVMAYVRSNQWADALTWMRERCIFTYPAGQISPTVCSGNIQLSVPQAGCLCSEVIVRLLSESSALDIARMSTNYVRAEVTQSHADRNSPAFEVWQFATAAFCYVAPPQVLHYLAAVALFSGGRCEEALDLLTVSSLQVGVDQDETTTTDAVCCASGAEEVTGVAEQLRKDRLQAERSWLLCWCHLLRGDESNTFTELGRLADTYTMCASLLESSRETHPNGTDGGVGQRTLRSRTESRGVLECMCAFALHAWAAAARCEIFRCPVRMEASVEAALEEEGRSQSFLEFAAMELLPSALRDGARRAPALLRPLGAILATVDPQAKTVLGSRAHDVACEAFFCDARGSAPSLAALFSIPCHLASIEALCQDDLAAQAEHRAGPGADRFQLSALAFFSCLRTPIAYAANTAADDMGGLPLLRHRNGAMVPVGQLCLGVCTTCMPQWVPRLSASPCSVKRATSSRAATTAEWAGPSLASECGELLRLPIVSLSVETFGVGQPRVTQVLLSSLTVVGHVGRCIVELTGRSREAGGAAVDEKVALRVLGTMLAALPSGDSKDLFDTGWFQVHYDDALGSAAVEPRPRHSVMLLFHTPAFLVAALEAICDRNSKVRPELLRSWRGVVSRLVSEALMASAFTSRETTVRAVSRGGPATEANQWACASETKCGETHLPLLRELHRLWWLPHLLDRAADKQCEEVLCRFVAGVEGDAVGLTRCADLSECGHFGELLRILEVQLAYPGETAASVPEECVGDPATVPLVITAYRRDLATQVAKFEWFHHDLPQSLCGMTNLLKGVAALLRRCIQYHRSDVARQAVKCLLSPARLRSGSVTETLQLVDPNATRVVVRSRDRTVSLLENLLRHCMTVSHSQRSPPPSVDDIICAVDAAREVLDGVIQWDFSWVEPGALRCIIQLLLEIPEGGRGLEKDRIAGRQLVLIADVLTAAAARSTAATSWSSAGNPCGRLRNQAGAAGIAAALVSAARECHVALVNPQSVLATARALRRAGDLADLRQFLTEALLKVCHDEVYGPQLKGVAKHVESILVFHYVWLRSCEATQTESPRSSDFLCGSHHNWRSEARGMICASAITYVAALWDAGDYGSLLDILFNGAAGEGTSGRSLRAPEGGALTSSHEQNSQELFLHHMVIPFLMPLAARDALRLVVTLSLNAAAPLVPEAQKAVRRCGKWLSVTSPHGEAMILMFQQPLKRANQDDIVRWIDRLLVTEPGLFGTSSVGALAHQVARGGSTLTTACAALVASKPRARKADLATLPASGVSASSATTPTPHGVCENTVTYDRQPARRRGVRTADVNSLINIGKWDDALRLIPSVITDPVHALRKALVACEANPSSWIGAVAIFSACASEMAGEGDDWRGRGPRLQPVNPPGLIEIGRICTMAATARQWSAALQLLSQLGAGQIDGYIVSQLAFALSAAGKQDLIVDLWTAWRSLVGDRVDPTADMVTHFLRAGCYGSQAMASKACRLLVAAVGATQVSPGEENKGNRGLCAKSPGTAIPVDFSRNEKVVVSLLGHRWQYSWQQALRVALASGRPHIVKTMLRKTPRNMTVHEVVMTTYSAKKWPISASERHAIAAHLDVAAALRQGLPEEPQRSGCDLPSIGAAESSAIARVIPGNDSGGKPPSAAALSTTLPRGHRTAVGGVPQKDRAARVLELLLGE